MRIRCGSAIGVFSVGKTAEGKVGVSALDGTLLATKDAGLINVSFVVDFDLDQVRYYVDGEYVHTSVWTYAWEGATDMAQFRFFSAGTIEFSELKIMVGDAFS